ncbi:Gfo/Idh/MocA family protein [Brevibacillus invocatus]|uniref:Gfo/Idh/MocA family protein n=1 Tax=Brevibacillus invocatus TaxID=173959 RepID=UPI00203F580D|nr:Gfo/Idh/MocA family oxidoreductase [Brevibacillus invocatus]MCM3081441.1 Gfo/Idh/MocA family oxidoreductase [Brevibacillus invocatus]MCM3431783.1 Gfo/Idh/MocA family oxidoreductase [Brevibacillus invocatus]
MSEKRYRIGMIGAGVMGERMIDAVQKHPDYQIVAISDVSEKRAQEAAARSGNAAWYTNYQELLDQEDVDLIYLAVPPKYHHSIALEVLARKKHLLCEKPLANSLKEAEEMLEAAEEAGVVHAMHFPMYYQSVLPEMITRLETVGDLRRIDILTHFHQWPRPWQQTPWLAGREQGGFIREVLPHFVHLTYSLFGDLQVVRSHVDYPDDPQACEVGVAAYLELADGTPVTVNGLAGIAHQEHLDYRIYGTKGTLSLVNWTNLYAGLEGEALEPVTLQLQERLIQLLDEMAKAISGEEARLVTFETGVKVQKVLEDLLGKE